ncbi:unnamed protein product [Phytomonas sp. Hart1]|nr:unnamed protein product [Phytomonas sp. Hart1]|eukprot:CCW66124.1 unnamed protein product [Phytomonas sp. isolate Hart1]
MDFIELGLNLAVLVHHLFHKHLNDPRKAFYELTLRTGSACTEQDLQLAQNVCELTKTVWYQDMTARFRSMLDFVRDKNKETIQEMRDLINELYPRGCATSEFANVVETCTALIPYTIHSEKISRFMDEQSDTLHSDRIYELSAEELTQRIVNDLLVNSMIPPLWWREDHAISGGAVGTIKVTKVALRLSPLEIVIQYTRSPWAVRVRKIHLGSVLSLGGPTAHIARRLARSHGSLLGEKVFQRLLIKLQHLATQSECIQEKPEGVISGVTEALDMLESVPPALPANMEVTDTLGTDILMKGKPQKADLGLLYRDPTKALEDVDLNDADELTTKEFKEFMNKDFQKVAIKPGDPGYIYDKRVNVNPTKDSAWDDLDSN